MRSLALASRAGDDPDRGDLIPRRRLARLWAEHWLPALLVATALALVAALVVARQPRVYAAVSTLLIEHSNDRVVDIKQVVDDSVDTALADAQMLTHAQQLQSPGFIHEVIASLTPEERARASVPYGANASAEKVLARNLKVQRVERTFLIKVAVRHRDPEMARLLANRVGQRYITYLLERSGASNDSALAFLSRQAGDLRSQLEQAELNLQQYRASNHLVLQDHQQSLLADRVKLLNESLSQLRLQRQSVEARLAQVKALAGGDGEAIRALPPTPEFAGIADLQNRIDELRARRAVMADRYGRHHPKMEENAASIAAYVALRRRQLDGALGALSAERDRDVRQEAQLQTDLRTVETETTRQDRLAVREGELRREVDTLRDSYAAILQRLNQTSISSRLQNTNVKLVDYAGLPDTAVLPTRWQIFGAASLVGLLVFAAYPWIVNTVDQRVRSWAEVEPAAGGVPLLAEVPSVGHVAVAQRGSIVARELDVQVGEAFRSLHGHLHLFGQKKLRAVVVTSSIPGEGKSFVAANLSASFAAHGARTLLIDADFRRPSLHRAYGLRNDRGILTWDGKLAEADSPLRNASLGITEVAPNQYLLRSGGVSRKMTELLATGQILRLLSALDRHFDVVVVDAPPAGIFPDAEILARRAAEVIYVCRFKGPRRAHVRQVLERMGRAGVSVAGLVLNDLPVRRLGPNYFSEQGYSSVRYARYYEQAAS